MNRENRLSMIIALIILLLLNCQPIVAYQRTCISLDETWQTCVLEARNATPTSLDTIHTNLPHNWDDYYGYRQLTHGNLHGTAVYMKHFDLPALSSDKRAFIRFEGVGTYATVFLNGQDLGRHLGGRVSFTLDVTAALKDGDNCLRVVVEHPDMIMDMPCVCGGCSSEWGFSEGSQPFGIYRPVVLEITDAVRIEPFGVHIWNNDAADTVFVETEIRNYTAEEKRIFLENKLIDQDGAVVFVLTEQVVLPPQAVRKLKQSSAVEGPHLWRVEDPYLYSLQTGLREASGGSALASSGSSLVASSASALGTFGDYCETPFGIRTISWPVKRQDEDGRFYLNGVPVFLNGTCEYEHLLGGGHAFSREQVAARVKQMRNAGFNAFRDAHQPHHLDYQKYWDEYGILFWTQFSAHIWYDTPEFRENFKTQLRQWVKERRNSPSVVLWGLQNESVLPEDFARECCEIIREMDPTAVNMRAITTCNGGVGSDWNVVQNWSGTYGGQPENYDVELSNPNQLLNGEYGAWRTLDLHETPDTFKQNGAYTEERFCQLLEMKIRLAEQAKDSVCGQFQWLYNSHDNPGRRQPDEAFRLIDRVGPVNYKGLVTPWEEPLDAYYMYRANYVSPEEDPMVYIVSHTWPERFASYEQPRSTIEVYSNTDSVRLYNDATDHEYVGTAFNQHIKGTHPVFSDIPVRYNVLRAEAYQGGAVVAEDVIVLDSLEQAPHFEALYDVKPYGKKWDIIKPQQSYHYLYRINCGGDDYSDTYGNVWNRDDTVYSHSWAQQFAGMNPYQASQRITHDPIQHTANWPLLGHFRFGRHQLDYRFPLPDGKYRVELYFVEPWYGTGGAADCRGLRMFDVAINSRTLIDDLDIWSEAGHDAALKKVLEVDVQGGLLTLSFPEVKVGQAVISAIAIATKNKKISRQVASLKSLSSYVDSSGAVSELENEWSWEAADQHRIARLPAELLPADNNPRAKATYPAIQAELSGAYSQVFMRKKEAIMFTDSTVVAPNVIKWHFSTGLAQVYALRFNYRNLSDQSLIVNMKLVSSSGIILKDTDLTFSPNDRGWKVLSTTTGSYINAGNYQIVLSAPDMNGLCLESLDVQ